MAAAFANDDSRYMNPDELRTDDQQSESNEVRFRSDSQLEEMDSSSDTESPKQNTRPEKMEIPLPPNCDRFTESHEETNNSDINVCYEISRQIFKVLAYILTFATVLISAIIAKGTLLFMTSQIRPKKTTPYCDTLHSNLQSYEAVLGLQEQAQWIWVIFFTFITPEVFTLLRSIRLITFKSFHMPTLNAFVLLGLSETLHTIGVALLAFVVLPELDAVKGLMLTNCLCLVPGVLKMLSRSKGGMQKKKAFILCLVIDGLAILSQLSGLVAWPLMAHQTLRNGVWAIPVGVFLTSLGWWENYVEDNSTFDLIRRLHELKQTLDEHRTRYFVYSIVSLWKMLVFFCSMTAFVFLTATQANQDGLFIFKYFITTNSSRPIEVLPTNASRHIYLNPHLDGSVSEVVKSATAADSFSVEADGTAALSVWGIQIATAYACYITSKFACRVQLQGFSFAFPITLTVPTAISLLIVGCGMKNADVCYLKNIIPWYLFWECPPQEFFTEFIVDDYAWIWFFWFVSQVWITFHIWIPKSERLASTEKIFLNPMYNAVLIDQSVVLNRRRDDGGNEDDSYQLLRDEDNFYETPTEATMPTTEDNVTNIKACITMWHESEKEMLSTLVSMMKLDLDQCMRRINKKVINSGEKDYYELEGHIFMDDAIKFNKETGQYELNEYAQNLITVMDEAATKAYSILDIVPKLITPTRISTPYGGRLIYTLLGGNKLYVHFKDLKLIRNRKRWSQVMYMYYLLGMKLGNLDIGDQRKNTKADNTYILALDGDIEFQPEAVLLLVDLMKKNPKLGAACGRIHPVGSGLMTWYQKFEYAIGHWLQKATEHVIGCVLCSPGCFSLFRGRALCENNVVKTYTKAAKEARHYVQYDQGEDRWLCTLLLQQGFRVEYAAASNAYTHCPESFEVFYKQRRRWVPSTMANIMDLLSSSRLTIKSNDDISIVYIFYQIVLMVSAIIGPGTILIMLVGAMVSAFGIDNWTSMWLNVIPVTIFILVCLLCTQDTQILVASVLTSIYALLMMAVLVGIFMEIATEGWLAPSSFFLLATASLMILTALLHPMEVTCLFFGVIYWVVIPSMYMLLIIYSAMNMNDVTWGVRETENPDADKEGGNEKKGDIENKENIGKTAMKSLGLSYGNEDDGEFCKVSCGNLWTLTCCTHQKTLPKAKEVEKKLAEIINENINKPPVAQQEVTSATEVHSKIQLTENGRDPNAWRSNSFWHKLKNWPQEHLDPQEEKDWEYVIEKYLHPLLKQHENKKKMAADLMDLRNTIVFAFLMINALFVVTIFLMQLHQDTIYIEYPYVGKYNISWNDEETEVIINQDTLRLEPIGFVFIIIFAGVMLIQFIAMLFHRFGTASQILATTTITFCNDEQEKKEKELQNVFQRIMKAEPKEENGPSRDRRNTSRMHQRGRRNTFHSITMHHQNRRYTTGNIEEVFVRRFTNPNLQVEGNGILRNMQPETVEHVRRRSQLVRKSAQFSESERENGDGSYDNGAYNSDDPSSNPEYDSPEPTEVISIMLEPHTSTTL